MMDCLSETITSEEVKSKPPVERDVNVVKLILAKQGVPREGAVCSVVTHGADRSLARGWITSSGCDFRDTW